ncbi:hypothetical protein ACFUTR_23560 [Streptomyces sp. NPDC057367]|uniref:hypothetical protein n=1 Tax=Streptomyces sp. NPDC057367 TaxID=3346108 RepID=UPI0036400DD4
MPGPAGVPRADIIALLQEGHSNREIGRRLHTNPKRVGRIRTELGIPEAVRTTILTLEQTWATFTEPTGDGHLMWTGYHREGTCPVLKYRGVDYSARRVAFELGHGRQPVGRVLWGCDYRGCVAPAHTTDGPIRRADAAFTTIFGAAA